MNARRARAVRLAVAAAALLGIALLVRTAGGDPRRWSPEAIKAYMLSFGQLAPLVYLIAYAQPIIPLPASMMTLAGGLAFGPMWGSVAAVTGAWTRACGQFALVRLFGREAVAPLLKGRVMKLDQRIGERGFLTVMLIRMVPNIPFDVQNYTLGLSRIRFGPYALGSLAGLLPTTVAYVYLGYSLTDLRRTWKLLLAIGVVAAVAWGQRRLSRRIKVKAL